MIGKLKGLVDSSFEDHVILDVGGVGYMVFCSSKTLSALEPGTACALLIETHVREDHIHLFGFRNQEEKSSFTLLQSVNGIGTRVAMMILSCLSPSELQAAIDTKDKEVFRRVSGVGPKLAERIIVELKGKAFSSEVTITTRSTHENNTAGDAISALTNLGMNRNEVAGIVTNILKQDPDISIDNLIRMALQTRSKS
jgi:Holliday junction DNA helicase RuvA